VRRKCGPIPQDPSLSPLDLSFTALSLKWLKRAVCFLALAARHKAAGAGIAPCRPIPQDLLVSHASLLCLRLAQCLALIWFNTRETMTASRASSFTLYLPMMLKLCAAALVTSVGRLVQSNFLANSKCAHLTLGRRILKVKARLAVRTRHKRK
jgi:hypothetical protein